MPEVFPFRAVRYNPARVSDLTKVTTQPYDRIGTDLQNAYYERDPHNMIRIIRNREVPGDIGGLAKYEEAARVLQDWISEGILLQEMKPCIYVYYQTYRTPQGEKTRKGLSAMVRLQEPGKGKIHPHEQTHRGPKIDRLRLLHATRTHTEQVFLIYSDPKKRVNQILDEAARRAPDLEARDDLGEIHRVWRIMDAATIAAIQKDLGPREAIIADGHHRYETAWTYRNEMTQRGARCEGPESFENIPATVVNMDDEGMSIFGTHRVVYDVPGFDPVSLVERARKVFEVREYPFANEAEEAAARTDLLEDLRLEGTVQPCFGLAAQGAPAHYLFLVRNPRELAQRVKDPRSVEWRSLDVNLLHTIVLEGMLGITPAALQAERQVDFLRDAGEAMDRTRRGDRDQAAFLVNPIRLDAIKKIVGKGERFPQKTTDFYPKLLTGLLLCKLNFI